MTITARGKKWLTLAAFLLPALAIYTAFQMLQIISSFYYALTDWDGFSPVMNFVGLQNFQELFSDALVKKAAKNSAIFTALAVTLLNGLALLLALLTDRKLRGTALFRAVFFIPSLVSTAVVGFIWTSIFNPLDGSWTALMSWIGFDFAANMNLLGNPKTALYAIVFVYVWQNIGYSFVIYLAGLQSIPRDLYEAAQIDGAGRLQRFRNVTFPLLAPALTVSIILSTVICLKQFDHVFVLTGGGPANASQIMGTVIYTLAFSNSRFGYGIAVSLVLFAAVAAITMLQLYYLKKREVDY